MRLIKISPLIIFAIFLGCSSGGSYKQIKEVVSVGWSDDRHFAYIANPLLPNGNSSGIYELHIAELAHNSSQIIKDSLLTQTLDYPYSPIAYCHTTEQVYFPVKNSIVMWDIKKGRLDYFAQHLPIKNQIEHIFAQPGSTMVYCTKSTRHKEQKNFFWWLVWKDIGTGEILFDTHDCYSPFGFFLENEKKTLHFVELDTLPGTEYSDTLARSISHKTRRIRPSEYSVTEIQSRYRTEWQSPSLKYVVKNSKMGLIIENI